MKCVPDAANGLVKCGNKWIRINYLRKVRENLYQADFNFNKGGYDDSIEK